MKKFIKGFLIFVVICGLIGVLIGYLLSTVPVLTIGARGFLIAVAAGQYEQAYSLMTPGFKERNNFESFKTNLKLSGLDQYKEVVWLKSETFPQQNAGYALGNLTTKQNTQFLVEFQFSVIQGKNATEKGWFINNIRLPATVEDVGVLLPAPTAAEPATPAHPGTPAN